MKFKIILLIIFLLTVSSLGVVSAGDSSNSTLDDSNVLRIGEIHEIELEKDIESQRELVENEDYEIFVGDVVSVEKMPSDAQGNITIAVDDVERYNQKISVGGNAIFMEDLNLDYGTHLFTFQYSGDDRYASFIKNVPYDKKYIDVVNTYGALTDEGSLGHVSVRLAEGVTGHIRVLLDGDVIYSKEYNVANPNDIDFDVNWFDSYPTTYEVQYFKGNQKDLNINGNIMWDIAYPYPDEVKYGEDVEFKIQMPEASHGIAKFNNATYTFEHVEGDDSYFTISNLSLGKNTVEIIVHVANRTISQNYSVMVFPFSAPDMIYVNETSDLIFNASDDLNGDVVLTGMVNATFKVINGTAIIPISSQNVGDNTLHITFGNFTWDYNIEVLDPLNLNVNSLAYVYPWSWIDSDGDSGPGVDIWLHGYDETHNLTGTTTIYLNDRQISQHQGEFNYLVDTDTLWQNYEGSGYYTVKATYSGDEYYGPRTDTYTFYMSTYDWRVNGNTLIIDLPCESKGTLKVKTNNRTYSKKITPTYYSYPGYVEHEFTLNEINYPIEVIFSGTPSIYSFNSSIYGPAEVFEYPTDINYGESAQFKINHKSNATLVLYINGYNVGNRLPVFEVDLRNVDHFTIDKNFIDNVLKSKMALNYIFDNAQTWGDYHLMLIPIVYSDEGSVDLNSIFIYFKPKVTGAKSIDMYYGDSKTINLKVYDMFGKIVGKNQVVKIKIGAKTFSAKTDKNGAIKFKIPNTIVPCSNIIDISYGEFSIHKSIKVKQVLFLKTVKVKKSAKKLVLTATLKNKKVIKNKQVTFKFNGKTYKAKTNSKGIAKITIKSNILKKLKVGKKITYQVTYLKDTVKKTVKVLR